MVGFGTAGDPSEEPRARLGSFGRDEEFRNAHLAEESARTRPQDREGEHVIAGPFQLRCVRQKR